MNNNGNTTLIEQKATLPNPFDSYLDNRNNNSHLFNDRNDFSLPKIMNYKEYSNDDGSNGFDVSLSNSKRRSPNFPPFFPIVYHSIGLEIPNKYSFIIRMCYYCALSFSYVLIFSFFAQMFSDEIDSLLIIRWRELILSFFILLICPISLFYGQYFPLYYAIRDEKQNFSLIPFQFFTIFFFFFFFIGIPGSGTIGIWYFIICSRYGSVITKIISMIVTIWHFLNLMIEVIILFMIAPLNWQGMTAYK
ncbi:hypothetical protein M9Y10_014360 [Tritrichomonas musculus]|uniref:Uncharacterized protein n=1 Tax=Tritrichomonas musculus TaxID=1915356 RepID=A0ABR2KZB4_9EUKA